MEYTLSPHVTNSVLPSSPPNATFDASSLMGIRQAGAAKPLPSGFRNQTPPSPVQYRLPSSSRVIPSGSPLTSVSGLKNTLPSPTVPSSLMGYTRQFF